MNRIFILLFSVCLYSCHSSVSGIQKKAVLLIDKHEKTLMEIKNEFDDTIEDSSEVYSLHTSQTTDYWDLSKFCRTRQNKIRKIDSDIKYSNHFHDTLQVLIPKEEFSNIYFKKHYFIGFSMRGVRNHNLEFQQLIYFEDSSSVHKTFKDIIKIDALNLSSIKPNTELDLIVFLDKHWAFTSADSLFQKAKFNCKR